MEDSKTICYRDFLTWHRRSGGALVAESDVSRNVEEHFGKFYVSHSADVDILSKIWGILDETPFLMEVVGVPGVGKTKFLKELVLGLRVEDFGLTYSTLVKSVAETFEFLDVEALGPPQQQARTIKTGKKRVWMTLNIDEYVSTTPGKNPLSGLYAKLKADLPKGDSLIICGNVGVLENVEAKQAIDKIHELMQLRNQKPVKSIRFPLYESLYWTKEYGVNIKRYGVEGDPCFLVSGQEGFQRYSAELVKLAYRILENCSSKAGDRSKCEDCIGSRYLRYLKELKQLLEETDLPFRLHDLMQFLWLEKADIYLVARALNIFWGYALTELWEAIRKGGRNAEEQVDKPLIYASLYFSKLPSIYHVKEYYLSDTNIHRLRSKMIEQELLKTCKNSSHDPYFRLQKRLEYFFEKAAKSDYREKIYGGVFEEYIDETRLVACITEIAKRLVLMRLDRTLLYVAENDEISKELFMEPWGFAKIMLATRVTARSNDSDRRRVPLMLFHESVLNDVDIQSGVAFEEIQHPSHYLSNREKILRLKLRLGPKVSVDMQEKAPSLHLGLLDYAYLRELTKGTGKPDIALEESTQTKVFSFLDSIEGFVTHQIRPILWKYLKNDIRMGDPSRILVRTLGPNTQRCNLKFEGEGIAVELKGTEIVRLPKGV
jgi:hypothetical protein